MSDDTPARQIPRLPVLGWAAFGGPRRTLVPNALDGQNAVLTTSGRAAIALALQALGLGAGDQVLVPTYHCPTMIAPVVNTGAEPRFFPINRSGGADLEVLKRADLHQVRAMIVAHYFGIPQPLSEVRKFCDARNIALIEDCAHAFFGSSDGRPIGSWGDFAIASLTKFFPVSEGGCLVSSTRDIDGRNLSSRSVREEVKAFADAVEIGCQYRRFPGLNTILRAIFGGKNAFRRQTRPNLAIDASETVPAGQSFDYDTTLVGARLTFASRAIARQVPRVRIVEFRRRNYELLASLLAELPGAVPLLLALPEAAVPYVFPLRVSNPEPCYRALREARVPIFRWDQLWQGTPELPGDEGVLWATEIFQLGCHQDMTEDDVRLVARIVRQIVTSTRA